MIKRLVPVFFSPMIFAIGFLTPLIAQLLEVFNAPTFGFHPLVVGFLIGGLFGLMAQIRGSWIWIK